MSDRDQQEADSRELWKARRKATTPKPIGKRQDCLVKLSLLQPDKSLPLVIRPAARGVDLMAWILENKNIIEANLHKHGAILFRDFNLKSAAEFESLIKAISGELLEYHERSSPRTRVSGNVYTSTDHPPAQNIFLHNENSYQRAWPLKIFFFCVMPALQGGETPIADCRRVYQRLPRGVTERFIEKKWMYVRNFSKWIGLEWQTTFQTTDPKIVEEHCHKSGIEVEWRDVNRLRTRAVREAIVIHPQTKEPVWFNHATFFHVSTLEREVSDSLMAAIDEEDLPTNTYYGDGSPIEPEVLDELRDAYRQETVIFPWKSGDVLMLDNMLVAHGRASYVGPRKILVGMAELYDSNLK